VINIDHHPGNTMYGAVNWFDLSAAACGEMVCELIDELGVPLSKEIATHIYIAILTDTGSFHYSNITPRTFDMCRRCVEAGVEPPAIARSIFDSNNLGRLKLFGAVLSHMKLDDSGQIATVYVDQALADRCGGTYEDTEGLINLPLTVKEIQAVVFFKENGSNDWRISMRSKGDVDTQAIAKQYGGGGHKNASGCSARGPYEVLQRSNARRPSNLDERCPRRRQAGRDDVARRRRNGAACARRVAHRPHGHPRSDGDWCAPARNRPGHSPRAVPDGVGQGIRRGDQARADHRHIRCDWRRGGRNRAQRDAR
jgi:phosphoesterase RecJ-like protein